MKLKLGPMEYEISYQHLSDDNIAEISYRTGDITIDTKGNMPDQNIRNALCHEIAHAMLNWFGISTECAEGMGQLLLDFVQRNSDIIAFLQSGTVPSPENIVLSVPMEVTITRSTECSD